MSRKRFLVPALQLVILLAAGTVGTVGGCGGEDTEVEDPQPTADPGENAATSGEGARGADAGTGAGADPRDAEIRVDASGRKMFGDVPLDVWFADPREVYADKRPVGTSPEDGAETPVVAGTDDGGTTSSDDADPPPAGGAVSWKELIPADVIDSEVTQINNRLNQSLVSVAAYNTSYLQLPPLIHTMAAMAAIAAEHPEDVRWKEDALHIRDLAGQMGAVKLMRGAKSQKELQVPFEQIGDILRGSPPAGEAPSKEVQFWEFADFGELMQRIDIAFNKRLKVEISSQEALEEKADLAVHEASIVAAIGKVITLEGYGYAEDEEFKALAQSMIDSGVQAREAARAGDFPAYDAAMTGIYKACTDCHNAYRD